jgi:hypothetical protein
LDTTLEAISKNRFDLNGKTSGLTLNIEHVLVLKSGIRVFFSRPDEHSGAVKWQRASAAQLGKSGGVLLGDTECCASRQQNGSKLPFRSPGGNDSASGRRKKYPEP